LDLAISRVEHGLIARGFKPVRAGRGMKKYHLVVNHNGNDIRIKVLFSQQIKKEDTCISKGMCPKPLGFFHDYDHIAKYFHASDSWRVSSALEPTKFYVVLYDGSRKR